MKLNIGNYPVEYDPQRHGPYDPARFYGKPDTPFGEVKIGELGSWLSRRSKSPLSMVAACSRAWWRWHHKYVWPKRGGIAPYFQIVVSGSIIFYMLNYPRISRHKHYKYH